MFLGAQNKTNNIGLYRFLTFERHQSTNIPQLAVQEQCFLELQLRNNCPMTKYFSMVIYKHQSRNILP